MQHSQEFPQWGPPPGQEWYRTYLAAAGDGMVADRRPCPNLCGRAASSDPSLGRCCADCTRGGAAHCGTCTAEWMEVRRLGGYCRLPQSSVAPAQASSEVEPMATLCRQGCGRPAAAGFSSCCRTCERSPGIHGQRCNACAMAAAPERPPPPPAAHLPSCGADGGPQGPEALRSGLHDLLASLEARLPRNATGNVELGGQVAVVTLLGSICPVTLGHVNESFREARGLLLGDFSESPLCRAEGVTRPARLQRFDEVLGFLSLNGDSYVGNKLQQKGLASLSREQRGHLVRLAIQDEPWLELEAGEGHSLRQLRADHPNINFTQFKMYGADCNVNRQMAKAAAQEGRYIVMGRPGYTEQLRRRCQQEPNLDLDDGFFVLGPTLSDISSTEARKLLGEYKRPGADDAGRARLMEQLQRQLHPAVLQWCLDNCPW